MACVSLPGPKTSATLKGYSVGGYWGGETTKDINWLPCGPKKTEFRDNFSIYIDVYQCFSNCQEATVISIMFSQANATKWAYGRGFSALTFPSS